jgi:hypothetical protein
MLRGESCKCSGRRGRSHPGRAWRVGSCGDSSGQVMGTPSPEPTGMRRGTSVELTRKTLHASLNIDVLAHRYRGYEHPESASSRE